MLQRIISIKNVGRFRNCAAAGDVTFGRITLVFAENGRGKTTLCAILRSLFSNTPAIVLGRSTLGSEAQPEAQFRFSNNVNIAFRNGAWTVPYPDIAVFDGAYVSDNVFAGDLVDTTHRRNLYRVIIGAQGVTLASRINDLDNQIRNMNSDIRDERAGLQRHIPTDMTVENFIALGEDAAIDAKIAAKEQERQAVQRAAQIQQRAALSAVTLPQLDPAFTALLGKTLPDVAADTEHRVIEHILKHGMGEDGQSWLIQGLPYANDSCPFCERELTGVTLIQAYKDFFSRDYHALREEVTHHGNALDDAFGERAAGMIERAVVQNAAAVEFWQPYCQIEAPVLGEAGTVANPLRALRGAIRSLLQRKAAAPLEAVSPDAAYTEALTEFEALRTSVETYNAAVAAANAVIAVNKRETQAADARLVESALATLRAQKARHTAEVRVACDRDTGRQIDKVALELEKTSVREQLDAHTQRVIRRYGNSINQYLEKINAGFRITTPTHTYRGGQPSTSYQIVINQQAVDLGDADTPLDRPSFRNTLSAGDKSTLALAFFLAELEQDDARARKTVVFDDPFTSQDAFRRSHTVQQIFKCVVGCAQIVVLSHDAGFLKLLWDRVAPADRKSLQLGRVGEDNTTIAEWNIEKAVMARYRLQIDDLLRFFSSNEGEPRDIIQKIRPVLEGYCCNLYPIQFPEGDTLGVIVGKIRAAGAEHPFADIVETLDELNIYCRRYMHGENPQAATEPVHDAELQGYVRRTLGLVGCLL